MRRARRLGAMGLIVGAVLVFPDVGAAYPGGSYVNNHGVAADASWWFVPRAGSRTYVDIFAVQGHSKSSTQGSFNGSRFCLRIYKYSPTTESVEKGCAAIPKESLTVAKDLSFARLSATRLAIHPCDGWNPATGDEICDPYHSRQVRISARWAETGAITPQSEHSSTSDELYDCQTKVLVRGESRPAIAKGKLNKLALGSTDETRLFQGIENYWSNCPPL